MLWLYCIAPMPSLAQCMRFTKVNEHFADQEHNAEFGVFRIPLYKTDSLNKTDGKPE
jgi:hypothetical protein